MREFYTESTHQITDSHITDLALHSYNLDLKLILFPDCSCIRNEGKSLVFAYLTAMFLSRLIGYCGPICEKKQCQLKYGSAMHACPLKVQIKWGTLELAIFGVYRHLLFTLVPYMTTTETVVNLLNIGVGNLICTSLLKENSFQMWLKYGEQTWGCPFV